MNNYSKKTKKETRRLSELAHRRELKKALADLHLKFKQWDNTDELLQALKHKFKEITKADLIELA